METEHYLRSCDKRELLDRITEILKTDILTKSDKRSILSVCLAACGREMAKMSRKEKK